MNSIVCYDYLGIPLKNLYQWDSNQRILISGIDIVSSIEVHFCHPDSSEALVLTPNIDGVNIVSTIPNILLHQAKPLIVYVFQDSEESGARTINTLRIPVYPRPKPADYIYTETEVLCYRKIDERLRALEAGGVTGGYYTPELTQTDENTLQFSFTASNQNMPVVNPVNVTLPGNSSNDSGQNLTLDTTLTQSGKAADAKAVGDEIKRVEGLIPSIEGLAKTEDIPTNPEDIGAQPAGNYLTKAPVESVNGKTGALQLGAADVGARPDNWMPTAQEVGALPTTYTPPNQTADQVGADPKGTAAGAVSAHNTNNAAHNDIRMLIDGLTTRLNALANSTDTDLDQMAEIVAYIKSNKSLIDAITTSKVSVADIINNLTTNVANKPLSAAQGVVLKGLIDTLSNNLANYQPKGDYALRSELPTVPTKVSAFTNDAGYLTKHQDISGKVDKDKLTLGRDANGLLYLYIDGVPAGAGIELPTGGIDGYITEDKQIIFNNLPDGEYTLAYIAEDGRIVPIGAMEKDTNVYYTVKNTLTNCTSNNSATKAAQGGSYSATITAKSGYELKTVTVTMGGSPVTVSGGVINITNVTGNIVITAVAEEKVVTPTYTNLADPTSTDWWADSYLSSSAAQRSKEGFAVTNFIGPLKQGDVIRIKGMDVSGTIAEYRYAPYKSDKTLHSSYGVGMLSNASSSLVSNVTLTTTTAQFTLAKSDVPYMRFGGQLNGTANDVIITINEPID